MESEKNESKPPVKQEINVPSESKITNTVYQRRLKEGPDLKDNEDKLNGLGEKQGGNTITYARRCRKLIDKAIREAPFAIEKVCWFYSLKYIL
jgi:hypothetical protein